MNLFQTQAQTASTVIPGRRRAHTYCHLLAAIALLAPAAHASFIGTYALANFNLQNQNADGDVMTPDAGLSIVLTGGNNGSGLPGTTDLFITAAASGLVQFDYQYFSMDFPPFDSAGFLLNGAFTELAGTSGDSGSASFSVLAGQTFGFRIATLDNEGEPGILTVSDFAAPLGDGSAPVPEPGGWPLGVLLTAALAVWRLKEARS
jgi:hypothetical protein